MRFFIRKILIVFNLFAPFIYTEGAEAKTVYVRDYGILNAKNSVEAYWILLRCHQDAVAEGCFLSYRGINNINLELPQDVISIPLPDKTDFAGVTIRVENRVKDIALFSKTATFTSVRVKKEEIDEGSFSEGCLTRGKILLAVADETPWVNNRKGTSDQVIRKDILLLERGKTEMRPISPYSNEESFPICEYCNVGIIRKEFKNLCFIRSANSNHITYLIKIRGQYNMLIKNVRTKTPESNNMFADGIISIDNSVKIIVDNLDIEGAYSQKDRFGYGIIINNVYDIALKKIKARTRWGFFCSNNVQNVRIEDCDVNRVDLHCYGKNFECKNCNFEGRDIPFSSVYGTVKFEKCQFTQGLPLYLRQEYNANTPFSVIWDKCVFNFHKGSNSLIGVNGLSKEKPSRGELAHKNLPNIMIKDCRINLPDNVNSWNIIKTGTVEWEEPIWNFKEITIDGLEVNREATMKLFTSPVMTKDTLRVSIKRVYEIKEGKRCRLKIKKLTAGDKTTITCDGQPVALGSDFNVRYEKLIIYGGAAFTLLSICAGLSLRNNRS